MITKEQILNNIARDARYVEYCKRMVKGKDIHKDLYQFIMMSLCEMNEKKLQVIYEGSPYSYITRMIFLNAISKTAPFYRQIVNDNCSSYDLSTQWTGSLKNENTNIYDSYSPDNFLYHLGLTDEIVLEEENEELENEEKLSIIESILETEIEFRREKGEDALAVKLLKRYTEVGSFSKIAKEADVSRHTIRHMIITLIDKINEDIACNHKSINRSKLS